MRFCRQQGVVVQFQTRQFLSYVWQFYVPRLPSLTPFRTTVGLPLYDVWIREGWGLFGFLEIELSDWLYALLTAITAIVAVATIALLAGVRDRLRLELIAFFAVAVVALAGGLHLTEYRSIIAGEGAILQGRYLLPAIGVFGLAVALIVTRIPARVRGPACGALAMALMLLQVLALTTVVQAYYT